MRKPFAAFSQKNNERPFSSLWPLFQRLTPFLFLLLTALLIGGCLVDNDKYASAKQEKDKILTELQELHRSNDYLNQEIARLYTDSDTLSTQLALNASLFLHDKYTTGLSRARQAAAPTPAPSRNTAASPGSRPRQNVAQPNSQSQPRQGGNTTGGTASQRGSGASRGTGGTASSATPPPAPPVTPPPATTRPRSGGAVDWGTL